MVRFFQSVSAPPLLSLKLAFTVSLAVSFSVACVSSSGRSAASPSPPPSPRAVAADLLSVLAGPGAAAAARVPAAESARLRSCLRFLSPVVLPAAAAAAEGPSWRGSRNRKILLKEGGRDVAEAADGMVMWPPAPVMELARIAVDSGGDPGAIHRALDPTMLPVPDVQEAQKNKCELTRTPYGRRFANKDINSYLAFLFELIVARGPSVGLNVSLSRYDFFHGHLFLAYGTGRLGILFHAKEYPTFDKELFPYNLGYCQAGVLVVLDAHPDGIIYQDMIPDYVQFVRTIYEDDFGEVAVDVNYLNVTNATPADRVFIC